MGRDTPPWQRTRPKRSRAIEASAMISRMRAPLCAIALAALSCSPALAPPEKPPTVAGGGRSEVAGDAGAGDAQKRALDSPPEHPSASECEALLDHTLSLLLEDMRRTQSPETLPTSKQVDEIRAALEESEFERCLRGDRRLARCGLAAQSVNALKACEEDALAAPAPASPERESGVKSPRER